MTRRSLAVVVCALAAVPAALVPAGLAAGGNYRLAPTKACLASKRVLVTAGGGGDFARYGVTGVMTFNFAFDPGEGDPAQGFLFFTRSPAAAKQAKAAIVRELRKLARGPIATDLLSLDRNVLLFWVVKAERPAQTRTIRLCLARSA